mmetsp:Transcript_8894/g.21289  ORF Transcript_8894/g.21289 Transcript_8894/m.21289 type:complete len:247 (-) Transcript_8894:40-780(-)
MPRKNTNTLSACPLLPNATIIIFKPVEYRPSLKIRKRRTSLTARMKPMAWPCCSTTTAKKGSTATTSTIFIGVLINVQIGTPVTSKTSSRARYSMRNTIVKIHSEAIQNSSGTIRSSGMVSTMNNAMERTMHAKKVMDRNLAAVLLFGSSRRKYNSTLRGCSLLGKQGYTGGFCKYSSRSLAISMLSGMESFVLLAVTRKCGALWPPLAAVAPVALLPSASFSSPSSCLVKSSTSLLICCQQLKGI